jgi:Na+/alanine symporter
MIIEGWILVLIILSTFILAFACVLGWIFCAEKLNQERAENKRLRSDIARLKVIIARKNGAVTIQEATEYFNESKKGEKK